MNNENQAVRDFAVNVLGCKCPDEVFHDIRLDKAPEPVFNVPLLFEIRVGGRLLILGVPAGDLLGSGDALAALVAGGAKVRDDNNFNRFRIVVVSDDADAGTILRRRFAEVPGLDDRMHLHVVEKRAVKEFMGD